nr:iron-sulfur cluster assembly accessory protein [Micromonospora sp. CB01531]
MSNAIQQPVQTESANVGSGGIEVVIDRMSLPYLANATIGYVDTIEQQGFTIDNPNAAGSCACGDSFH